MRYDKPIFESADMQGMLARHLQNRNRQEGKKKQRWHAGRGFCSPMNLLKEIEIKSLLLWLDSMLP
jgi:hypothetical protein